jgi:hypothetical protein
MNKKPIFIIGNQKTGSTAIAFLLSKATGRTIASDFLAAFSDDNFNIEAVNLRQIIRQNLDGFSKKIIKELTLVFWIDQVMLRFPKGQFVMIVRDPRDNIRSILNRLRIPGNLNDLSQEILQSVPERAWRHIIDGRIYNTHGHTYIATLANRWVHILNQYEKHKSKMHLVRYEDFILNKKAYIDAIAGRLGLKVIYDISSEVDKQYQPKGDRSVTWQDFFGHNNLRLIEEICSHKMQMYGYQKNIV